MDNLLKQIRGCEICLEYLPNKPNPIVQVNAESRIIIIGQSPGRKVHETGIPWDDASGEELRRWLGVEKNQFYDASLFGLIPMGFCYPGKGKSGDLPPRPECAPAWHQQILTKLNHQRLTLLIGQYSQKYYLGDRLKGTLTDTVKAYLEYLPGFVPLVHPSPRNRIWQKKNPWFELDVVPSLRSLVQKIIEIK